MRARRPVTFLGVLAAATAAPAQVAQHAPRWSLDLGAQEHYQSSGQQANVAGDDFVTYLDARLGRRFPSRRGGLELSLNGGAVIDHAVGEFRHFTWGASVSGSRALSRRGELRGLLSSALGFARDVSRLEESVVVPPYTLARSDRASVELRHRLPGALEGSLSASGERFTFDSPELVDGWTAGMDAELGRGIGPRVNTGVSAGYRRSSSAGSKVEIGRVSGRVGVLLARELTLTVNGGVSRYSVLDLEEDPQVSPVGGVALTGRVGRHTVSAGLSQRVEQTYGLGTIGVSRALSLRYGYEFSSRLAFTAAAADTRVSEQVVGEGPDRSRRYTAGVSYDVLRNLTADVHYAYWDRGSGPDEWQSHAVAVSLRTRFGWR